MLAHTKQFILVGLLAALPNTIAAQTADQSATTTAQDPTMAQDPAAAMVEPSTESAEAPAAPVGDINDLIIKLDGSVEGVVIGVGGFLGLGEKDVAVKMDALSLTTDPEFGTIRLTLGATREELEAAPEFKTAAEQQYEAETEQIQQKLEDGAATTEPATGSVGN
ncbi:PRC-barrel domain-containing protein [Defluviimonas sp. WL0002]|uniref:PRC-barrel domain-containing protein n=1 Tax=Albidovulum marisflavi TaxID=2984159 RepID=A0ABT2ZCA9_9RHOB|nr:PRC-barrel domain-containing protein [Defluviimonas sp. WL0002]MCV2868690.1 PRC-barrel domain-containing protein [Defluviimonas sp. WL0002]